jgi:hypothetical protein
MKDVREALSGALAAGSDGWTGWGDDRSGWVSAFGRECVWVCRSEHGHVGLSFITFVDWRGLTKVN